MARGEPVLSAPARAAVLGSPIVHSLSPCLHRTAYAQLGLGWTYEAIEVRPEGLAGFIDALDDSWAGLSLTMPLKQAVLPLLDSASDLVGLVGAANTVVLGRDGRIGHNTDVVGMVTALGEATRGPAGADGPPALAETLGVVIGAGATAASAVAALARMGLRHVRVHARRPEAAGALRVLAARLDLSLEVCPWPDRLPGAEVAGVVVSTVPAAAAETLVPLVPPGPGALLDVSYAPWPQPLVRAWKARGGTAIGGELMLLHQAAGQVRLMTGRDPDVQVMRAALLAELAARSGR